MNSIKLELPLPPAINASYGVTSSKKGISYMYKRAEAKRWQRDAFLLIYSQTKDHSMFNEQVVVKCELHLKRDRDVDSSFKLLCDTLENAKIIKNDRQIVEISARKFYPSKESKMLVEIYVDSTTR